jgi:hypothetical protein
VAKVFLGLANRNLVNAFNVFLCLASATRLLSVALSGVSSVSLWNWDAIATKRWAQATSRSRVGQTFARFLRHSVHAFGVTTPRPRFLFDTLGATAVGKLGVLAPAEDGADVPGAAAGMLPPGPLLTT